ncbi:MAG: hypothetical protein JW882_00555, partial [Deltaproteobacteria bacterium]|nr:hypothetical protein [Deltaproteobacteria bacterium]
TAFEDLSQRPEVYQLIREYIDQLNQDLQTGTQIKRVVLLNKEFDPDKGELTRNLKLRKAFLRDRYRDLIDAVYKDRNEVSLESQVSSRDGQTNIISATLNIKNI